MATVEALGQTRQQAARQVLVSIPDRKLAVMEDGQVLKVFPVAVGAADSPSPAGEFQIINRLSNPTYYHKGTVIGPGPENPLGTRWMGLNLKGFGIHGTNAPRSIGKAASHGCIRMAKRDLEQVFDMLRVGDTVVIRAEADEQTAQIFGAAETVMAQAQTVSTGAAGQ
jgi:lipoprotein-anchoring transpeptidase ErfK/SrfK